MTNPTILGGRRAEIMLVEDNLGDEILAVRAFRTGTIENNFTVAGSGEEAWAMLKRVGRYGTQRLPDLILLDLNLPKMSGKNLLLLIKTDDDLRHIPVIVMTSSEATTDIKRSYDLYASAYIVKPMDIDAFKEVVTTIEQFFFIHALLPLPSAPPCDQQMPIMSHDQMSLFSDSEYRPSDLG